MVELNRQIARLEMRSEQVRIHLQALPRNSGAAAEARSQLYGMLQQLVQLKTRREQLEAETPLIGAA